MRGSEIVEEEFLGGMEGEIIIGGECVCLERALRITEENKEK